MEKQTVENKVKEIAEAMGLTYLCESWFRANQAFDRFRRQGESREVTHPDGLTLPACLYVQPVAGFLNFTSQGFVRDAPSCLISFADAMPLDYKGADAQEIAERLKGLAVRFIVAVNESGFFVPVAGQINYRVAFDKMDANLCIVTLSLTLQEQAGVCFDYGLLLSKYQTKKPQPPHTAPKNPPRPGRKNTRKTAPRGQGTPATPPAEPQTPPPPTAA